MFGIGKAFKKAWKGTFGKIEDAVKPAMPIIAGAALGALTGGIGFSAAGIGSGLFSGIGLGATGSSALAGALAGGAYGGLQGYGMYQQGKMQEAMINAQLAAADKIAAAQQAAPTIQGMAAPTATAQEASVAEQNNATTKRKAFSFAKTARAGSVQRRNTLG